MATWSAPGKVFLFGEHAVVYGRPGIAMAVRPRVFVTVRKSRTAHHAKSPYIDNCFDVMGVRGSVYVNSQLPSSSGLGSSAAVTVATLAAINDEFGKKLQREEIAEMAFAIEKKVQKGRASPTDTTVATFGGLVFITGLARRRLPPQNFQMVIGNTLVQHNTGRMVEMVAELKAKSPEICEPVLEAIGAVSLSAIAGSSTRIPPAIFRKTSFEASLKPHRFSSTASNIFSLRISKPVALRWGVPYAAVLTRAALQ